jgi:ABC-type transport system substrate-binding protein
VKRLLALSLAAAAWGLPALAADPPKILRVAFRSAETSFDPVRIDDLYSRSITAHIFEAPYHCDHLARPLRIRPLTAAALPEVADNFRRWTVRIAPGTYFANDPAFNGQRRELVAQDYVYAFKRFADPANISPVWPQVEDYQLLGLAGQRQAALAGKRPFDYDHEIEGVRALDRYTLQFRLAEPRPRFLETLASNDLFGAVAREVVERYGDAIGAHPVGTGAFRLKSWRRSSQIVLERNPQYRERYYEDDAAPGPDDKEGQALLARFKGRRLPMIDEVQVVIIEEEQPRWLSFLNGQLDALATAYGPVPPSYIGIAMPNGKLAPNLAKLGLQVARQLNPDMTVKYFNMEDPVVGGYTPDKVALRRAIGLATDVDGEIRLVRRGQAVAAQSPLIPNTSGYDPSFRSENGEYNLSKAKALLDLYGYVDRDGDGWRDLPDGAPLVLEYATQPDQIYRQLDELWKKGLDKIGVRVRFEIRQWAEQNKLSHTGRLMMWGLGSTASVADGQESLQRWYGPQSGGANLARFKLPAFDAIYDQLSVLPDGPERNALFRQAELLAVAYMPYKVVVHRMDTDMLHPWVSGYRRPLFWLDWWQMVDIDSTRLDRMSR